MSSGPETPLYDELGRPMNGAAEEAQRKPDAQGEKKRPVQLSFFGEDEAKEFSETVKDEKDGYPSPYLTRAVLMNMPNDELARRIKQGAGVNVNDPVFGYPLAQALEQHRSLEMVKFLLDNGANPNLDSPLFHVLHDRYIGCLQLLLKAGADPTAAKYGDTPAIIVAAREGQPKAVAALLDAGAKVDATDDSKRTALYYALKNHTATVAPVLLDKGASVKGFTALLAIPWHKESIPVAIRLLELGASPKVVNEDKMGIAHWAGRENSPELLAAAIKAGAPVNMRDAYNAMPLYAAATNGQADLVKMLLAARAPVNDSTGSRNHTFVDTYGKFHRGEDDLLPRVAKKGNEEVIRILLAGGVDRNTRENSFERPSALHNAINEKAPEVLVVLLEGKVKPNIQDRYDRTPLHIAAKRKDLESARLLIAAKAKVDVADEDGETPLICAAEKNSEAMVQLLLTAGAKPGYVRGEARPALSVAAGNGNAVMVRALLAAKADPNLASKKDDTSAPLLSACYSSNAEVVQLMLEAGADPNPRGSGFRNATPLYIAVYNGKADIVRLLLAAKADPHYKADGKTLLDVAKDPAVIDLLEKAGVKPGK